MVTPRVVLLPGSIRSGSLNRRLADALAAMFVEHGIEAEVIDLGDHPMPIYDGDDEAASGPPSAAAELHDRLAAADALVIVTPEYNGGPTALLKNAIDWVTRVDRGVFRSLLVGLAAASPGSRGGAAGLRAMRHVVDHMRLDVVPDDLSIPHGGEAFDTADGGVVLTRPDDLATAERWVAAFVDALRDRLDHAARAAG